MQIAQHEIDGNALDVNELVVTRSSYGNRLHYDLSMFAESEKLPSPSAISISARFHKSVHFLLWNLFNIYVRDHLQLLLVVMCIFDYIDFTLYSTIAFLMISYFIVAHCTFTTNFSSILKSQF